MNLDYSKEEVDITALDFTNDTTCSSRIRYVNVVRTFYAPYLVSED